MSRWKELPAGLHPDVRLLIVRLRGLKDHGEASTRQLAAKSGYSTRSWQRYLNGRSMPPREAVEAMAHLSGDDPARLLVLHELAAERWAQGRGVTSPATDSASAASAPNPTESRPHGRWFRALVVVGAVALVLSASSAFLLALRLAEVRTELAAVRAESTGAAPTIVSESLVPVVYTCRPAQRDGRWYAGLSRTDDTILAYTHVGPEVAEAQCLLRRAGFTPGDVDGVFGPKTQRAVQSIQTRDGLVVDGVIGRHTWKALREAESK